MKLVEPVVAPDVFASGLGRVDVVTGGFVRFVMYVERTTEDGSLELHVVCKIVMPQSAVPDAVMKTTATCAIAMMGMPDQLYH